MRIPRVARRLVRRSASLLPSSVLDSIVTAIGIGGGPAVGAPAARRIVVLSPHPDDESLGCGGLIAVASRSGADVTVVFATDGDDMLIADKPTDLGRRRRKQGADACAVLGARPLFLGLADGRLAENITDLTAALDGVFSETRPDLVVLPWFADANRDHRALNRAFAETSIARDVAVWGCEVWTPLPANRVVDITDVIDDKLRAIAAHTADIFLDPEALLGLHRYRAAMARIGGKYAEAYYEAPAAEYFDRVRSLARA
jgi:LmbE family N-acetylglucosaminyl deacetylase